MEVAPGDHIALFYRTRAEQFMAVSPFIRSGLERNEFCLYIAHDNSAPAILSKLSKAGVDGAAAQARGALQILTREQSYLKHGIFEPQQMVDDLAEEVETKLAAGFSGLRASGEMTWALDVPDALIRLREYEARLHRAFGPRLTGLCQYDETRFSPSVISDALRIHPKVIANGRLIQNPLHRDPDVVMAGELPEVKLVDLNATVG